MRFAGMSCKWAVYLYLLRKAWKLWREGKNDLAKSMFWVATGIKLPGYEPSKMP